MSRSSRSLWLLLLAGCNWIAADYDGDGLLVGTDCDDRDATVGPQGTWFQDSDGDGFGAGDGVSSCTPIPFSSQLPGDCDDADAARKPGQAEVCNGIDDDCSGEIDDDCTGPGARDCFEDVDGDGYGATLTVVYAEACPAGFVELGDDCNDADADVNPGRSEDCDTPVDDDCDGAAPAFVDYYDDRDGDGYGNPSVAFPACGTVPSGLVDQGGDCDDTDAEVNPAAVEICNGRDDDCSGVLEADESDADGDGFASCANWEGPPPTAGGDCDDAVATVYPGAPERCDGVDTDCDGINADLGLTSSPSATFLDVKSALDAGSGPLTACGGMHAIDASVVLVDLAGHPSFAPPVLQLGTGGHLIVDGPVDLERVEVVGPSSGGCLEVQVAGALDLTDADFRECSGFDGAAIRAEGPVSMLRGLLSSNSATARGGAVACLGCGALDVDGTVMSDNTAGTDGGAVFTDAGVISAATFTGGQAQRGGAVFYAVDSDLTVLASTFGANSADRGGAVFVDASAGSLSTLTMQESSFVSNTASEGGAAVWLSGGPIAGSVGAIDCVFQGNVTTPASGATGAIVVDGGQASLIVSQVAGNDGHGASLLAGTLFSDNTTWGLSAPNTPADVGVVPTGDSLTVPAGTLVWSCTDTGCDF